MKEYRVTLSIVLDGKSIKDAKKGFMDLVTDDYEYDFINKELQVVELYKP